MTAAHTIPTHVDDITAEANWDEFESQERPR
jgi:hypothetical protein